VIVWVMRKETARMIKLIVSLPLILATHTQHLRTIIVKKTIVVVGRLHAQTGRHNPVIRVPLEQMA